jgi:hypothetical protein
MASVLSLAGAMQATVKTTSTADPLAAAAPAVCAIVLWGAIVLVAWKRGGWKGHWRREE